MALPVLMYHGLHVDERSHGRFDPVYSVTPDAFAQQLDALLARGFRSVRLGEPPAGRDVLITFDDGDVSNVEVALPLLRERGMTAEFFVTSDFVGTAGMLSPADVRTLSEAGMGIGSHGRSHRFLEDLDDGELVAELRDSRELLQRLTGEPIDAIALPGGRGAERERRVALELGYRHLLGSVPGRNARPRPGHWMQRFAVTRHMSVDDVVSRVTWRGLAPRVAVARHRLLQVPKRLLGNAGYERLRARLL